MKKFVRIFLSILLCIVPAFLIVSSAQAAEGNHTFSLITYDTDIDESPDRTGDELSSGDKLEAGKMYRVDLYYTPATPYDVEMQVGVQYDPDLVEPYYEDGQIVIDDLGMATDLGSGGIWPAKGTGRTQKNSTYWGIQYNDVEDLNTHEKTGLIMFLIADSSHDFPLSNEGTMLSMYFTVKDNVSPGTSVSFSLDPTETKLANKAPVDLENSDFVVDGEIVSNTNLSTLTVKNGSTNYLLTPSFVADTSERTFTTVVPNAVSSVDIAAVPSAGNATIANTISPKALSVGNNTQSIIVQQGSVTDTYTINIYRLSNDSSLSNLSLSGVTLSPSFATGTTNYTASVPYGTNATNVSATVTDTGKAKIQSGTGSKTLSVGSNDINVVVKAENCDSKYSSVPGNTASVCSTTTYKVAVTRANPSTNATLSYLTVDGVDVPGFSPTTYTYNLPDVANSKTKVNIAAAVTDTGKATITTSLGEKSLSVGDNAIKVTVKAEDGTTTQDYTINIKRLSNNSKLGSLSVTSTPGVAGTLSPAFAKGTYEYTYTAPANAETVTIAGTVDDTGKASIVSGPGEYNLSTTTAVNVVVKAEDNSESTYKINLVRTKSTNNNLATLSVDGYTLTPAFTAGPAVSTGYAVNVASNVDKVNVSATVQDVGKATIVSGTGEVTLNYGLNTKKVKVKAESGAEQEYTLLITRAKKTNSKLSSLTVDGTSVPSFSEDTLEYDLPDVAFSKKTVEIAATTSDSDATVTGTGTVNLSTGDNALYVVVTAQDGLAQTTYTININRAKNSNNYLSAINIDGSLIDGFVKTDQDYDLTVENNVTSLNLTYTTETTDSSVTVSGNSNFATGVNNEVKLTVTAENGDTRIYKINVARKKSSNNNLSGITVSSGTLSPAFNSSTTEYTVDVDRNVTSITITPTLADLTASYVVNGPSSLQIGDNEYEIVVTAEDNTEKKYTITVNRNKSNNNYLASLTVDGTSVPSFNKETSTYSVTVDSSKSSVELAGTTEEEHATISGLGTKTITSGSNPFDVVVTAEDGTERTYTITITKAVSTNSKLNSLSITQTSISPVFNTDTTDYTADVEYSVTNIDIVAVAADSNATISGDGNKSLTTGANTFDIVVTAEDGSSSTKYTIVVTRAKNNNANLSNIELSGGFSLDPAFTPGNTGTYTLTVPNNVKNIEITAIPEDTNVTSITNTGLQTLSPGDNDINIEVTAEDGSTKQTYKLKITRERSTDATLKSMTLSNGTLDPEFNPNTEDYTVSVNNEVTDLDITAIANSEEASVDISGNDNLKVGENNATVTVTAGDGSVKVYKIKITRAQSANNFLSALSVKDSANNEYITSFVKTQELFEISVANNIDSVVIASELEDSSSSKTGDGTKTLSVGENEFDVVVTSATGVPRTYKIKITKAANSNTFLSSLEVENYSINPEFNKETYNYTLTVDASTNKVKINAVPEVETSTVTGTGEIDLVTGSNTITVTVTAENGAEQSYVISITKETSSNNYLSGITLNSVGIEGFDREITEYTKTVGNEIETINIDATPEDEKATIVSGTGLKTLTVGDNEFEIKVKAENGDEKTYKVIVIRSASSNNFLSDLTVDGATIENFNKNKTDYTLNVDNNVTSITIGAEAEDENAVVTGTGVIDLNTGTNNITIAVAAEDGTVKNYEIIVTRAKNSNNYLSSLDVEEGDITPEFNKETTTYSVEVPYEEDSITVNATTEVVTSEITKTGVTGLTVGSNEAEVIVKAEDGTEKTYKINVTRLPEAQNFLSNIIVTDNNGVEYPIVPIFNKDVRKYQVPISPAVSSVDIDVTKENPASTVTGDGTIPITSLPQTQNITVTSDGIRRIYKLEFVAGDSNNANLLSLSVNPGSLDPAFTPLTTDYSVTLTPSDTSITVLAEKSETTQTIQGTGTHSLNPGRNDISVIVTAESGSIKVYKIVVTVPSDASANKLKSLSVDKGTLTPAFDKDVNQYTVDLENEETEITISATGDNTITGTGTKTLAKGTNVFTITTTDDSGNVNEYKIIVNNGAIDSTKLSDLSITDYNLNETFDSNSLDYTAKIISTTNSIQVNAIPKDSNATVTISGNDNLVEGNNTITITVSKDGIESTTYTITAELIAGIIKSNVHTINDLYVETIKPTMTSSNVKDEMINPNEYLKIYDLQDNLIAESDIIKTGFKIKLVINNHEYDSKILIIKGDINSDGNVNVADSTRLRKHLLELIELNAYQMEAAKLNADDVVNVADSTRLRKHLLGLIDLFQEGGV